MEENKLIMLVGLPRSGKTTLAKKAGHPIVNPDAIRLALHGQAYVQSAEGIVWAIAHLMVESLFKAGHPTVILDACNNSRKRRDEWKSKTYSRSFWIVPTPADVCRCRAEPNENLLKEVIDRMESQHEPVDPEEGELSLWDCNTLIAERRSNE
jgi:predicted kinase